ncbi:hypothetical protein B8T70_12825 [Flavobacterium sp. AJR]|nr:hypothetical protein B8T70_12825 [Flavobacterium sp. AJR]
MKLSKKLTLYQKIQLKNSQNKLTLLLLGVIISINALHSQTNKETSIHNLFDKAIGKENLAIYNGSRHVNYYRTIDNSHSYYFSNNFSIGNLNYEGQDYNNLDLKYDVNNDVLVLKATGEFDYLGINVIKEKTASFSINNKNFINVNYNNPTCPDYMNGYYQEIIYSPDDVLYIKHHKNRGKIIDNKRISDVANQNTFDEFIEKNDFILKHKGNYYKISSKSDIIKIFPESKSKIKNYYNNYSQLEESDKKIFIENLIKEINSTPSN